MISRYARKEPNLGLRWMICSRPEPDLKVAFSSGDCAAICVQEKLVVDDSEAQDDAFRILRKGFTEIREKYPDQVTQDWPAEEDVRFIADRASGHLGFVSFIIRFIGDKVYDDPPGQLEVCLRFLQRTGEPEDLNPLHALDLLYTQILSDIPSNVLPITQRILRLFIFHNDENLSAAVHANFLGLKRATFYQALRRLHSVIIVPPADDAYWKPIQIYHASFTDYLQDPSRSGKFVVDDKVVRYLDIALSGIKWLGCARQEPSARAKLPELTWIPPTTAVHDTVLESLCKFSFIPCWKACPQVPKASLSTLIKALEKFDFNLDYPKWEMQGMRDFAYFIRWLASLGSRSKTLLIIKDTNIDHSESVQRPGTKISHENDDPYAFVAPFLIENCESTYYSIHLQLGRLNPTLLTLEVSTNQLLTGKLLQV
ncbi:hypothetical protein D9756_009934 [Leucocoprinus leucothites]|uniref:Uncharacterized protein n=1 Tax=Leucocoprinus leucothites TaxID=201217 RepID=A0A8H5CSM1_9AGAR|nr:hypothetical protein D9756_009934 [Leucoagaricus leucothites]